MVSFHPLGTARLLVASPAAPQHLPCGACTAPGVFPARAQVAVAAELSQQARSADRWDGNCPIVQPRACWTRAFCRINDVLHWHCVRVPFPKRQGWLFLSTHRSTPSLWDFTEPQSCPVQARCIARSPSFPVCTSRVL